MLLDTNPRLIEKEKKGRDYYLDWCRALGIHVVLVKNCVNSCDTSTGMSLIDENFAQKKKTFFMFLTQFGIPIFFFISGAVATLFDAERPRGFMRYLQSKTMRLFVPLIVCVFVYLIPRHYIGQVWDPIGIINGEVNWDFATYVPSLLADNFLTKLGPLWFLPAIFIIVLVNYPLIKYSKRRAALKPWMIEDTKLVMSQLALVLIAWNIWCKRLTEQEDFIRYIIPGNFVLAFNYMMFFAAQWFMSQNLCSFTGAILINLLGVGATFLANIFNPGHAEPTTFGSCTMLNYHMMFFAQGIVFKVWKDQINLALLQIKNSAWVVVICIANFVLYGLFQPGNTSDTGFLFVFPIYLKFWDNVLFVLGSWQTIYCLLWFYEQQLNSKFDDKIYSLVNRSSMFCYLVHDFWQTLPISGMYPFMAKYDKDGVQTSDGLGFTSVFIITIILSEVMSILNFLLLEKLLKSNK